MTEDHAAQQLFLFHPAEQETDVITGLTFVEEFAEHFDAGTHGFARVPDTDNLDIFTHPDLAALDTPGAHGAATGDAEDILDRHQEGQIHRAFRHRNVFIDSS